MKITKYLYAAIAIMTLVSVSGAAVASASTSSNPPQTYCLAISPMKGKGFIHSCGYTRSECNRYKPQELAKYIKKNPKYKKTATAGCSVQ
ncbi:hypothetical protein EYC58_00405 [Candidatus Saccharibacteria bacterium]|nr:MAG: hypothetical protein EYC58_00405 [Candidatus Saccharibacteria bacterium]